MLGTKSTQEELARIVGKANVRPALPEESICGVSPQFVAEPENEQQVAAVLSWANAAGISVIPRGGGTKMDWGNPPKSAELILSTGRLNRIVEHVWADLTVTVEAGCTLQSLQSALAKHGQRLAFDGLWPERATVGGVLSTNDSGVLRLRFGALRDLIIGVTLALPGGTLASSGGKVVKNVAGYDLPKLATGALGTLGVITRAVFRLYPIPRLAATLTCSVDRASKSKALFAKLLDSKLAFSALQLRFADAEKPEVFLDILFEGIQEGIAAQIAQLQSIASPFSFLASDANVWQTRQSLHSPNLEDRAFSTTLKMAACPGDTISAIQNLCSIAITHVKLAAVVQATGLGTVRITGDEEEVRSIAKVFRKSMESAGGSLLAFGGHLVDSEFDSWGSPGDALPLMRALKQRLDPQNTLNPGRFVGGI